jgi:UDP-3-O-[3-hydroxymyristoyl] glucosamine N-acyltransferase
MSASFPVTDILTWTGGRLANSNALGEALHKIKVSRPAPLAESRETDLAFFFSREYECEIPLAAPGVLITSEPFVRPLEASGLPLWKKTAVISCLDPYLAMAIVSEKFAPFLTSVAHVQPAEITEIHPSALIDPTAELGPGIRVGANCVVEAGVRIGAGTVLYPGCYIGPKAVIGENCVLFPRVTLYELTEVGSRVRIHAGATIGADGFGYAPTLEGKSVIGHRKIYHLGRVIIGDDVEIGANSTVDRGTFGPTRIERNAKLDNLVHLGHNSRVAEGAIICGGTCLAGNASVGKFAYIGGLTGIVNHVHVGDGAKVAALTLVSKDVPPGGTAVGNPQRDQKEHFKAHAKLNRLVAGRGTSKKES